jgi:hypothetical protein
VDEKAITRLCGLTLGLVCAVRVVLQVGNALELPLPRLSSETPCAYRR